MSDHFQIFRPGSSGASWFAICAVVAACIVAGRSTGLLTEACLVVIFGYAFLCGVLPYFTLMRELAYDVELCGLEHDDLTMASSDQAEQLLLQDDTHAGSVHKLAKVLAYSKGRGTKEEITDSFLECFDESWTSRIESLRDVANYCPTFGIAGTMLGLADIARVLESDAGNAGVGAAIATMSLTTLAGGACFVLISGLARRAINAVAKHRKDLRYVAAVFQREPEGSNKRKRSDNPFSQPGASQ